MKALERRNERIITPAGIQRQRTAGTGYSVADYGVD